MLSSQKEGGKKHRDNVIYCSILYNDKNDTSVSEFDAQPKAKECFFMLFFFWFGVNVEKLPGSQRVYLWTQHCKL